MGVIDEILGGLLAVAILCASGALWYADHEHARILPLQQKIVAAQNATLQAQADREAAQNAALAMELQLRAAEAATHAAQIAAADAASAAAAAHAKLATVAHTPGAQKALETPVPSEVWQTIYATEQ